VVLSDSIGKVDIRLNCRPNGFDNLLDLVVIMVAWVLRAVT